MNLVNLEVNSNNLNLAINLRPANKNSSPNAFSAVYDVIQNRVLIMSHSKSCSRARNYLVLRRNLTQILRSNKNYGQE